MPHPHAHLTPSQARRAMAAGEITGPTAALCPGHGQANLVILPRDWAFDFLLFGLRNPRACPILEVLDPGQTHTRVLAERADVRSELPRYRVFEHGRLVDEPTDIDRHWRGDLVSFFLGCSFSFDAALAAAGLPVRHLDEGRNVPMYRTSLPAAPAGRLSGPLVVSMRPMPPELVPEARRVSGRFGGAHGAPVHAGDPGVLGIADLAAPDYGEAVTVHPGEIPVFWACGVTPQAAIAQSGPPLAITHAPGHMFICDLKSEELDRVGLHAAQDRPPDNC